jgi:hypothetical protein
MYMAVALLVWVAWIINPTSLNDISPRYNRGDFFLSILIPRCFYLRDNPDILWRFKSLYMKWLLCLLCSIPYGIMAQDCRHILMKKGAQLEYSMYMPKSNLDMSLSSANVKISRILFDVDQVRDSAGSTYSTIIKRGFSVADEKNHYERRMVLQCDGTNLHFPYDLYTSDTLYTRDIFPKERRDNHGYAFAFTPLEDAVTYIVPLVMDGINKLPEGKKQLEQKVKERVWTESRGLVKVEVTNNITIKNIRMDNNETVKTEAGSFVCFKIYVDSDQVIGKRTTPIKYWMFFNPTVGLVKMEGPGGILELVSFKK